MDYYKEKSEWNEEIMTRPSTVNQNFSNHSKLGVLWFYMNDFKKSNIIFYINVNIIFENNLHNSIYSWPL